MPQTEFDTIRTEELETILLSSPPLKHIDDLFSILTLKPNYIGPGPWLAYIREKACSGQNT